MNRMTTRVLAAVTGAMLLLPLAARSAEQPTATARTWQGIPGLERTPKGRVFISWFSGGPQEPSPENTVYLCRSDDQGITFTAPVPMAGPTAAGRAFDPTLWRDPTGKLWYIFNRGNKTAAKHGVYARTCADPDAATPVWSEEFRVGYDETPLSFRINKPTVLSTGEWIMPVTHAAEPIYEWFAGAKQLQGVGISTDQGQTWTLHGALKAPHWALENMIVQLRDGRLWMLIRTGSGVLWQSHSANRGQTWSEPCASTIANPGSRFFIRRLASGNLLLVNHYKFNGRSHLTAQLSADDGQTWNEGLLLDERNGVSYPDGVQADDGLIWIVYDHDRQGAGEILLARFREQDVAVGKNVTGDVRLKQVVNRLDKTNLITNGDFEQGLAGWSTLWSRTPGAVLTLDTQQPHGGKQAVKIEHTASTDWSLSWQKYLPVQPGQIYELSGWVRGQGEGRINLAVTLRDTDGRATAWTYGGRSAQATDAWRQLRSRFVVPPGTKTMQLRLTGNQPVTVWFDDVRLELQGSLDALQNRALPPTLKAAHATLEITLDTATAAMTILDRRCNRSWVQSAQAPVIVLDAKPLPHGFDIKLFDPVTMLQLATAVRLVPEQPEFTVDLTATGEMGDALAFPHPLATDPQTTLILPVNEGISYPAADASLHDMQYNLYSGHGLCMTWYGQTDGRRAAMAIVETADDADVQVRRANQLLQLRPRWEPQKGQFGAPRRIRYAFFDDGGYVAMCKRYRHYAQQTGLLHTLAEKRAKNRDVDLLVGAVNVWCFDKKAVEMCRDLQAAGIERILWSNAADPHTLEQLNALGVLTSRYDIYQDAMNPANFPKLAYIHSDWTSDAWPKDLMLDAHGDWQRGWEVTTKDGKRIPCGVLCDRQAVPYAQRRIPAELQTHPYHCRFIDTTTASPWRECYHPDHPMTRSESRHFKMELLRYISEGCGLVTGSETGHDAAVPYVHYFEGMLSLGPYRVPDAGRNTQRIWDDVPELVAKFQTGHFYRLPLWELVYHDCVVAQWYWGDYNNKLPTVWDQRDLINVLYGTPPMFMFNHTLWEAHRARFVQSYRTIAPVARAAGYSEMLDHRWLTADHVVQQTQFANGVKVTVNFGDQPYALPDGVTLAPRSHRVEGLPLKP